MSSSENQRRNPRVSVILKVEYGTADDFFADYTSNASDTGLFIATERMFQPGDMLDFAISFPGLLAPIHCRAEVRWQRRPDEAGEDRLAGIGVAFRFESPDEAQRIRDLMEQLRRAEPEAAAALGRSVPFRVLLAEDNPLVREMLRFAVRKFHRVKLGEEGVLEVSEVENGQRGVEEISLREFDIAIVDYFMPVMDGGQLIRKIREHDRMKTLPVIAVSVGGDEARRAAYQAGADLFLDKPLMLTQLIESLQRLLQIDLSD